MNKELEEAIRQLKDIKQDKESFIENDREHDEIFEEDIKAIETVLNYIDNSISKEVLKEKLSEIQPKYIENVAKINKEEFSQISIKMYNGIKLEAQKSILQELLEGK